MEVVSLIDKLTQVEERYEELERLLADPQVAADDNQVRAISQERAEIAELLEVSRVPGGEPGAGRDAQHAGR